MQPSDEQKQTGDPRRLGALLGGRWGRAMVLIAVLASLGYGGLLFAGDSSVILAAMRDMPGASLALAAALSLANYLLRMVRWQYYLRALGVRVPWGESGVVFFAGFSMSITPGKLGEVLKSALLKDRGHASLSRTAPIIVAERVADLVGLMILIAIGSIGLDYGYYLLALTGVGVIALMALLSSRRVSALALRICTKMPVIGRHSDSLNRALESLRLLSAPGVLFWCIPISVLAWFAQCVGLWLIVAEFTELEMGLRESLLGYSLPLLAGTLAMLPGGLGLAEWTMTGILNRYAVTEGAFSAAAAITILDRLVTFWLAVFLGVLALGIWYLRYSSRAAGKIQPAEDT